MRQISILGSTGSIGCNTLRVVDSLGTSFGVAALGGGKNVALLADQVVRYKPKLVSVSDEACADRLRHELDAREVVRRPAIGIGVDGLIEVATCDGAEVVIGAVVGALGLLPTYHALEKGLRVALANKETLVIAGELMTRAAERSGAELLPVDSEHNALHQCLRGTNRHEIRRLILTASGGPFRLWEQGAIDRATKSEALRHPTWRMGDKITIDSATLMNKGLEVIEARWLFGRSADEISIVVHPQSVVHSMIEFVDGSVIAQLGVTDMRHAIQYALTYPERMETDLDRLDLTQLSALEFFPPDTDRFPCIELAYSALRTGGTMPAVLNAANEVAVSAFLDDRLQFGEIPRLIRAACEAHTAVPVSTIDGVLAADKWARQWTSERIAEIVPQTV